MADPVEATDLFESVLLIYQGLDKYPPPPLNPLPQVLDLPLNKDFGLFGVIFQLPVFKNKISLLHFTKVNITCNFLPVSRKIQ